MTQSDKELADGIELKIVGVGPGFYKELAFKPHQWQQIIAALRRQPSSDKVLVPREPTVAMVNAGMDQLAEDLSVSGDEGLCKVYRAMLSAAAAEGHHE